MNKEEQMRIVKVSRQLQTLNPKALILRMAPEVRKGFKLKTTWLKINCLIG